MNMSYCRFQNTLEDLRDCAAALEETAEQSGDPMSHEEQRAAVALIETCARITAQALEKLQPAGPRNGTWLDADDLMDGGKRYQLQRLVAGQPVHDEE